MLLDSIMSFPNLKSISSRDCQSHCKIILCHFFKYCLAVDAVDGGLSHIFIELRYFRRFSSLCIRSVTLWSFFSNFRFAGYKKLLTLIPLSLLFDAIFLVEWQMPWYIECRLLTNISFFFCWGSLRIQLMVIWFEGALGSVMYAAYDIGQWLLWYRPVIFCHLVSYDPTSRRERDHPCSDGLFRIVDWTLSD